MPFKIYYLDDEPELLEIFTHCFAQPELAISTFTDPQHAINVIHQFPPDLLILDYRMPNITGDEVAQAVDVSIPKVMITGDLEVVPKSQFLKIFRKPYNLFELKELIDGYLTFSRKTGRPK